MDMEVLVLHPALRFVVVSFPGPLPQYLKDGAIDILKDFLAHHMLVIACPPANERIEQQDQVPSRGSLVSLHYLADFLQKAFHVFLGRLDPRDTQRDESKQATILRGVTTVLRGGRTEKWSGKAR